MEPSSKITSMSYDTLRSRLATLHANDTIRVYRRPSSTKSWVFSLALQSAHAAGLSAAVAWAPPSQSPALVATVGADGLLALYSLPVVPDGGFRGGRGAVRAKMLVVRDARGGLDALAFAADGVLVTVGVEGVARVYKGERGEGVGCWVLLAAVEVGGPAKGVGFMPGTSRLFCAGGVVVARGREEWEYGVWTTLEVGGDAFDMGDVGGGVCCVDWGSGGCVAVGRGDGAVEIWAMQDGDKEKLAVLECAVSGPVEAVQWDLGGNVLASVHGDGKVRTWTRRPSVGGDGRGAWPWSLLNTVAPESAALDGAGKNGFAAGGPFRGAFTAM